MTTNDEVKTRRRVGAVLAASILAIGLARAATCWADPCPVEMQVVDRETDQTLPTWRHHGRLFVAGEPGARYGLRLTNHTGGRVLLVVSVDGVNVVSGETADYGQRGYVLDPYGSFVVKGWRKSTSEVAAFAFAPQSQSYAARTGRPDDVGVIGMAVYRERAPQAQFEGPQTVTPQIRSKSWDGPRGGASGAAALDRSQRAMAEPEANKPSDGLQGGWRDEKLGTAHGAREWSEARLTTFERATPYPQWVRRIEYDTYDNLVASGVIHPSPYAQRRPRPFPSNADGGGFVADPPNYP